MRSRSPLLLLLPILATSLSAQQTTSPRGYLKTPGNAIRTLGVTTPVFGTSVGQIVQIDDTQKGRPQTIRALHLRRHATTQEVLMAQGHTMNLIARMGHGDYSKVAPQGQDVSSMLVGAWVDVVPPSKIQFPDMSKLPNAAPAPWSVKIPLSKPFAYDGKNALLFQLHAWNASPTGDYPFDAIHEGRQQSFGGPVGDGKGCKVNGRQFEAFSEFLLGSSAPFTTLFISAIPQVSNTAAGTVVFLGATNPNRSARELCAPVLAAPDVILTMYLPVFRSDGQNGWGTAVMVPHSPSFVGLQFYVQAWAADSQQGPIPLAGSRGWQTGKYPRLLTPTTPVASYQHIGPEMGTFVSRVQLEASSGVIVGLEQ